jgi:hypothetical protein
MPINLIYTPPSQVLVSSTSSAYAVRPNLVGTPKAVYAPRSTWKKSNSALNYTLLGLNAPQLNGLPSGVSVPTPSQYFGNAGRNVLHGAAFAQLNLAVHKSVPLWSEASRIEFRIEAFNALNSTNFLYPDSSITDGANFCAYTAASAYPARQVQLAMRLSF